MKEKSAQVSERVELSTYGNRKNNINLLRFIAASLVIYYHMDFLLGKQGYVIMGQGLGAIAVNIFFLLSGYLIASSWKHSNSFVSYFIRRTARIFPALVIVVFFSVFCIGPLFTSLSLSEYYSNQETWNYLKVILFFPIDRLPGVFEGLPCDSAINGSLWTLRYEFAFYLIVPFVYKLLDYFGETRRVVIFGMLIFLICGYFISSTFDFAISEFCKEGFRLATYFFMGCVVYEFNLIKYLNAQYSVLAVLFMLVFAREEGPLCLLLMIAATTVFVFSFAFASQPKFAKCFEKNDFSYGIYIWAFPIQQIVVQLGGGLSRILFNLCACFFCNYAFLRNVFLVFDRKTLHVMG